MPESFCDVHGVYLAGTAHSRAVRVLLADACSSGHKL